MNRTRCNAMRRFALIACVLAVGMAVAAGWCDLPARPTLTLVGYAPADSQLFLQVDVTAGRGPQVWEREVELLKGNGQFGQLYALIQTLWENFRRARGRSRLVACESNLKSIATGLEMYATDHDGRYPADVTALTPSYLQQLPACPAGGRYEYTAQANPDAFTVMCTGGAHRDAGVAADGPTYTSTGGLDPGTAAPTASRPEEPAVDILQDVLSWAGPEAALAVFPAPGTAGLWEGGIQTKPQAGVDAPAVAPVDAVRTAWIVRVRDQEMAEAFLRNMLASPAGQGVPAGSTLTTAAYRGVEIHAFAGPRGIEGAYAFTEDVLVYALGPDAVSTIQTCLDTRQGRAPSLATSASYGAAAGRLSTSPYLFFVMGFESLQGRHLKLFSGDAAAQGDTIVASLKYLTGSITADQRGGGGGELFLALDPDRHAPLVDALLAAGHPPAPFASLAKFPSTLGAYGAWDGKYLWNVAVAALSMDAGSKRIVDWAAIWAASQVGANDLEEVLAPLTGEVAYGLTLSPAFFDNMFRGFQSDYQRGMARVRFTACEVNVTNIATALEMYATDHRGVYPARLSLLMSKYLPQQLHCPSGGKYWYQARGTHFRLECRSNAHAAAGYPGRQPAYDSRRGLAPPVLAHPSSRTARRTASRHGAPNVPLPLTLFVGVHDYAGAEALYDRITESWPSKWVGLIPMKFLRVKSSPSAALTLDTDGLYVDFSKRQEGIRAALAPAAARPASLAELPGYRAMTVFAGGAPVCLGYLNLHQYALLVQTMMKRVMPRNSAFGDMGHAFDRWPELWSGMTLEPEGVKLFLYAPAQH